MDLASSFYPLASHTIGRSRGGWVLLPRRRGCDREAENRGERANFKELHRVRSRLERIKVQREAQIAALVAKCEDLQMLKFGQLIKLELLDQDSQANKGEEELTLKIEALEGE